MDPYDSIWLKLGTILVYIVEGKPLSIINTKVNVIVHYITGRKALENFAVKFFLGKTLKSGKSSVEFRNIISFIMGSNEPIDK